MNEIANFKVDMFGENWTLADMCFKPPSPPTGQLSSLGDMIGTLLDKIIPCIWITPID
uniref:Uncharacterized protein n=1 Tax=Plectus sambesii TaxID=2011161 RepID=A0A914VQE5_9BILA